MATVLDVLGREARVAVGEYVSSAAERWDHIYARGFGERLDGAGQRARHYVIAGLVADLCDPGPRVLDIGSGFGTTYRLLRRIEPVYHGVDVSSRAVQRCRDRYGDDPFCSFEVAAFERWEPDGTYDAVILNEVLHCFPIRRVRAILDKAIACLAGPRSVLVISMQRRLVGPLLWAACRTALPAPRQDIRVRKSPLGGWTVEAPSLRWRERVS
jgi:SAM-dependent methyltransferase